MLKVPNHINRHTTGLEFAEIDLGESFARVFRVGQRFYLKCQALYDTPGSETLLTESSVMNWLSNFPLPVPRVIEYAESDGVEYLLVTALSGQSACDYTFGAQVATTYGRALRMFHDTLIVEDCPFDRRRETLIGMCRQRVESQLVDESDFDPERQGLSAREVLSQIEREAPWHEDLVVSHGDYCLPNVLLNPDLSLSGFIDLGRLGVSDRHRDLALAARSLSRNFGVEYLGAFYDSYGMQPQPELISYYQLVDELF